MVLEVLRNDLNSKKLLLDAGCWCGPYSILFSNFHRVIGIDLMRSELLKAREWRDKTNKKANLDFIVADIHNLPFRESVFDIVLCLEVLEHVNNIDRGLREFSRVIKTNAIELISMPNRLSLYYIFQRIFPVITPVSQNPHLKFQVSSIKRIVSNSNFKILKTKSSLIFPVIPIDPFYESTVKILRLFDSVLNKTFFKNFGAHYLLKLEKNKRIITHLKPSS